MDRKAETPVTRRDALGRSFSGVPNQDPPRFPRLDWFRYMWWSFMLGYRQGRPKR